MALQKSSFSIVSELAIQLFCRFCHGQRHSGIQGYPGYTARVYTRVLLEYVGQDGIVLLVLSVVCGQKTGVSGTGICGIGIGIAPTWTWIDGGVVCDRATWYWANNRPRPFFSNAVDTDYIHT